MILAPCFSIIQLIHQILLKSPYKTAFSMGLICAAALPPVHSLPLTFVGLIGFFYYFVNSDIKRPWLYSYLFAFGYFLVGLYWIGNALLVEGNHYKWAWPLAVIALPAALACFYGVVTKLALLPFKSKTTPALQIFILSHAIFIAELARSHMFTGFPWNLLGTAWADELTMIQLTYHIGLSGMTWLILLISALFAMALTSRKLAGQASLFCFATAILCANFIYGINRIEFLQNQKHSFETPLNVITIQPDIAQHEKWDPDKLAINLEKHIKISLEAIDKLQNTNIGTLLIWPETSIGYFYTEHNDFYPNLMSRLTKNSSLDVTLVTGVLQKELEPGSLKPRYSNSLQVISKNGAVTSEYKKSHLVPFGEYIPFNNWIPISSVTGFDGLLRGNGPEIITISDKIKFIPKICYEIIFANEMPLRTRIHPLGDKGPKSKINHYPSSIANALIHITNDAWYGNSSGPIQHNIISQIRAVETGLYILRSSNKGVSTIISPSGYTLDTTYKSAFLYATHTFR